MDNKKISVDDLFRQRLTDREAPIPPGAWSRMEGLLDAKMPVGSAPVATTAGRRRRAFLLLGLLIAGGGSFLYQALPDSRPLEKPTGADAPEISGNYTAAATTPASPATAAKAIVATPMSPLNGNRRQRVAAAPTTKSSDPKNTASYSGNSGVRSLAPAPAPASGEEQKSIAELSAQTPSTLSAAPQTHNLNSPVAMPVIPEISGNKMPPVRAREEVSPMGWIASRAMDVFSGKMINPSQMARVENFLTQWAAGANNPVASNKNWSAKIPQNMPVAMAPTPVASNALPAPTPDRDNPTPLTAAKPTAATQTATMLAATPALEQKVEDAVADLRSARYTIGLLAGINSTLSGGTGALQGLQAAVVGLLKLSEKWHIGAEVRYALRLNNSMDLKDDYFSGKVINEATVMRNGRPYNAVRYEIDSMMSRYSFNTYSHIELPLQLRFDQKRFSVYGGPSFAFHFAPSVTRTNTRIATISRFDTLDAALPLPTLPGRTSDVSLSDFDSRFSLGYHAGAQYRLTPSLSLDLRLSQQLWDNRQGRNAGSRRVSETYLHIPSVQLSVGYFFRHKKETSQRTKP